jgi:two-component system, chemotaxis family, CheB/CheR fusion protein
LQRVETAKSVSGWPAAPPARRPTPWPSWPKRPWKRLAISRDVKIFATDIDRDAMSPPVPASIRRASSATCRRIVAKYFYHKEDKLQIARHLREMVVFAQHNLIKDPPFTNIDLISCRNLLIYLQPVLQQKAFEMFNFSLNPDGLLFLGTSERSARWATASTLHQKHKIYRSKGNNPASPAGAEVSAQDGSSSRRAFHPPWRGPAQTDSDGNRIIKQLPGGGRRPLSCRWR